MFKMISFPTFIGLEHTPQGIKGASVVVRGKIPVLQRLFTFTPEEENVKPLYKHHPILTTGVEGKETLVRPLRLPLTKEKDIEAALVFQAEPLLPYPVDQAFLAYQMLAKTQETSDITLLSVRKEALQAHLEAWQACKIEPEKVGCVPSALCQFGSTYFPTVKTYLIVHVHSQEMTCVVMKENKLWASFTRPEGLDLLLHAQAEEDLASLPQNLVEWQALEQQKGPLALALRRLQQEMTKMGYALAKESRGEAFQGIVVTGEVIQWQGLSEVLVQNLNLPLLTCEAHASYSSQELLSYAVPIGLAWGSLPGCSNGIDYRQQELSYPHPWRRLRMPVVFYLLAICLLSVAFYFFGQQYLHHQEDHLRQTYIDLLGGMNKSHERFEAAFVTKNPQAHELFNGEIPRIEQLHQNNLIDRVTFLQKELQSTPDSFPLFANIPRVSDTLAWLSQHPSVAYLDEEGKQQVRLQIEDFTYAMLKRPQQGKKQEKYQVKIELEFSSPTPKWAREFHDALIVPNEWVDPKGEVKWNSNRGKYKTSFFLKDKTIYPSS